ncbi:MAG: VOC family protein [Schumannella sp.]
MTDLLAADTAMGAVTLNVADPDRMTRYYRDAIGLEVLAQEGPRTTLGRPGRPIVILEHSPELRHAAPHEAGLFHTAILFDTQEALAEAAVLGRAGAPGHVHRVERPPGESGLYSRRPGGQRRRTVLGSRPQRVVVGARKRRDEHALPRPQRVPERAPERARGRGRRARRRTGRSRVHLSVGDVPTAREFYVDRLGFERTFEFPGQAVFVSAGGYHHHMAMNIWNSRGARSAAAHPRLGRVDILVPDADDLGALTERMTHFGTRPDDGQTVAFDDLHEPHPRDHPGRE